MKLEGIPVPPEKSGLFKRQPKSTDIEKIDLLLTVNFNEQRELLFGGRMKFGLRGGKLSVKLENGQIPPESCELGVSIELAVQKQKEKRQQGEGEEQSEMAAAAASQPGEHANPNIDIEKPTRRTERSQFATFQVTTKGSQEHPVWVFQANRGEPVLKGFLKNVKLGTLQMTAKPCRVEAVFVVSPRDVHMTEAEGLWPPNISKKRRVVIERAIVRRFLRRKLKPYLSRQELRYDE